MGRGRAKAKQTKVARELKYRSFDTDFSSLERELREGRRATRYRRNMPTLPRSTRTTTPRTTIRRTRTFGSQVRENTASASRWPYPGPHEPEPSRNA